MHQLLFFEFIGTSELMVVLVVALIIFGPRKLPELGRSLGQALHQVRSASADFKRTWETEASLEAAGGEALAPTATESRQELGPGDTEAQAGEVGETHAPAHEAQPPTACPTSIVRRPSAKSKPTGTWAAAPAQGEPVNVSRA
jgi:TatA/E family protein of Tat protein translocase